MSISSDWQERHPKKSGKGRLVFYILLLLMVIFLILRAETLVGGFTRIFFPPDSTSQEDPSR